MDQEAIEFLEFGVIAMIVLSLLAAFLLYLNRLLDRREKARLVAKAALRQATRAALSESSADPQLSPLPTYEEVLQVELSEEDRFKRPFPLRFELLSAAQLLEKSTREVPFVGKNGSRAASLSETVAIEMPPPSYDQTTVKC